MHFKSTIVQCLTAIGTIARLVRAMPVNGSGAEVACDSVRMFDQDYFKNAVCRTPKTNECLFYTFGLAEDARQYAQGNALMSIWGVWRPGLYNDDADDPTNPLRCIVKDDKDRFTYFSRMSFAFATLCGGTAHVMSKTPEPGHLPQGGIWSKVEFPKLKAEKDPNRCNEVKSLSPNGQNSYVIWKRPGTAQNGSVVEREQDHTLGVWSKTLWERETDNDGCGAPAGAAKAFNNNGKYPVNW